MLVMNKFNKFFLLIFFTILLLACGRSPRERSKIPPAPIESERMRSAAALEALSDAIRSNPSVPENYYKRARLNLQAQKFQEALDDINRADRLKSNIGRYLFVKALALRELGKFDESLVAASNAEILNIDTPEINTLLGDLAQRKGDFKKAESYLAKSLQVAPYNGETYYYKGLLAARKGDTTSSIKNLLTATELKPKYLEAYSQLTTIFKNRQMNDSALVFNNRAINYYPDNSNLLLERGLVFQNVGKLDSAISNYNKAFLMNPERVEPLIYEGAIYFRWKSYIKAIEVYETALKQSPNLAKVYYLTGICYEKLGSYSKAEEYYKTAFEKDPKDSQITDAYTRVSSQINQVLGGENPILLAAKKQKQKIDSSKFAKREPERLLDTTRIRINVIAPKAKVLIKSDSTRRIKIN
jgi:tetratricopeptide (TPR) repeat protein